MADTNILYDEQGHPRHFNIVEDADTAPNRSARKQRTGRRRRRKPPNNFWQAAPEPSAVEAERHAIDGRAGLAGARRRG